MHRNSQSYLRLSNYCANILFFSETEGLFDGESREDNIFSKKKNEEENGSAEEKAPPVVSRLFECVI